MVALSRNGWVGAGLVARLLMIAMLAVSVHLKFANHTRLDYSLLHNFNELQGYTYAVATAVIGMAASALQVPAVAVYLLCKSKRTTASVLVLDVSMYTDVAVTALLASGVGAGFGATDDVLQVINHATDSSRDDAGSKDDLNSFLHRGGVAIVLLLVGMLLSLLATVVSARLRVRASDDNDD